MNTIWDNLKEFGLFVFFVFFGIGFMLAIFIGIIASLGLFHCNAYEKVTGNETKYSWLSCYYKINGQWYFSDEYNKIYVAERKAIELEVKP